MLRRRRFAAATAALAVAASLSLAQRPVELGATTPPDLEEVARKIEQTLQEGRAEYLTSRIDMIGVGQWVTGKDRSTFAVGFRNGLLQARDQIRRQLRRQIENGGSYKFLGLKGESPDATLVFRVIAPDGAFNYHEMRAIWKAPDDFLIVDLLAYNDGNWLSETSKANYVEALENVKALENPNPTPEDKRLVEGYKQFAEMSRIFAEEPVRTLKIYDGLPPKLQKSRMVKLIRLQAAMRSGDEGEYVLAMEEFEAAFPGDSGLKMILIDAHFLKQRYDETIANVDELEKILGVADPYLNVMRGVARRFQGRIDEAVDLYREAVRAEPGLIQAHSAILDLGVAESNYALVVEGLRGLEEQCGVDVDEIVAREPFQEFRLSEAHDQWRRSRADRANE